MVTWIEKNKLEWTEVSEWKKSAYFSNSWLIHENYGTMQEKGRELYSILSRVSHPTIESAGTNDKPNIHIWNDRTGFAYLMLDISSEKLLKNYIKYLPQDPTEKKEVEKLISSHMEKASEYREIP